MGTQDTGRHVVTGGERRLVLGWAFLTDGHNALDVRKVAATQAFCSGAVGAYDTWRHVVTAGERRLVFGWASLTDGHKASDVWKSSCLAA